MMASAQMKTVDGKRCRPRACGVLTKCCERKEFERRERAMESALNSIEKHEAKAKRTIVDSLFLIVSPSIHRAHSCLTTPQCPRAKSHFSCTPNQFQNEKPIRLGL